MTHNDEEDEYENNSIVANYSRQLTDQFEFKSNLRFADTFSQYDKEVDTATATHSESADVTNSSGNIALVYKPNKKFTNKFTLANTYIKRIYHPAAGSGNTVQDNYYGERNALLYSGNYNFNLDNSIAFGLEREDDQIAYNKNMTGMTYKDGYVTSSYFDIQSRITNNIYTTFGARFDEHSLAGNEDSHRATVAIFLMISLQK